MGRPPGRTNADHEEKRRALATAIADHLAAEGARDVSLRGLARVAGVSTPTLRHYFDDLDGALHAAYATLNQQGQRWLTLASDPGDQPLDVSIPFLVRALAMGFDHGLSGVHAAGLTLGLGHDDLGPAYLQQLLEPTIEAVEARLAVHRDRGELADGDLRTAALGLLSPIVLAVLHQRALGGCDTRPLDLDAFVTTHARAFLRGWAAAPAATPR